LNNHGKVGNDSNCYVHEDNFCNLFDKIKEAYLHKFCHYIISEVEKENPLANTGFSIAFVSP